KNGVRIDGAISMLPNGTYQVEIGHRRVVYREAEVLRLERNNRIGRIDREAALRRWAEQDKTLTARFGLNAEQRRKVDALIQQLQREEDRIQVREQIIAMQTNLDVVPYVSFRFEEVSHRLSPWVLETLAYLDAPRVLGTIRQAVTHPFFGTRAKAIELLGILEDKASAALVTRGLVDPMPEVQLRTVYALAHLDAKAASPALISLLGGADRGMRNASLEALRTLWAAEIGDSKLEGHEEWCALWTRQAATVGKALTLDALVPLISPEEEFQDE
ncbi:MAG TPA: HEAT repeat domain-containing protein, partial [Candidatus Hydrogenedentes bacterium]|nr:HEAT repeat domain-containing protein [Candidatus Hydrogenedentota bacterium]